jgi:hypothetical protein
MKVQMENLTVPKSAKEWFSWRIEVGVEDEGANREY